MAASLKEKLTEDLKQAMRSGNTVKRSTIRLLMSAIQNAEIAKKAELDDSGILGIIAKEARQRRESIEAFKSGNRQDLVEQEEAELAILEGYLPPQMSREEISETARRVIQEVLGDPEPQRFQIVRRLNRW